MLVKHRCYRLLFLLLLVVAAAGCNPAEPPPPSDCGGVVAPVATRPMQSDPDLLSAPAPPPPAGSNPGLCPTPPPEPTSTPEIYPIGFIGADLVNVTLDVPRQDIRDAATGDDMIAIGWIEDEQVYVALSRGGKYLQVRAIDQGQDVSLAFSRANRLHVAYEKDGEIYYRAADQGTHPADVEPIFVEHGRTPQVVVDELNWAHVLYEQDGSIFKAKHLSNDAWLPQFVAYGTNPVVIPFYNEKELVLWGIPTGTYWFGIIMAAPYNGEIRVFRYLSWFNVWEQVAAFPIPPGEELTGAVGLDYLAVSEEEAWVYAAWVNRQPSPDPPPPTVTQPTYEPVNPFAPTAITNPQWVHAGLNAARWHSEDSTHDAALYQVVNVGAGQSVTFSAWGQCWSSEEDDPAVSVNPANCRLAVGIDPQGGTNPNSPDVIWSGEQSPLNAYAFFTINAISQEDDVTVFLRSRPDSIKAHNEAYWDTAEISVGTLQNGDFESIFSPYLGNSILVAPDGWIPVFADDTYSGPPARDIYKVYAAWSSNGGGVWTSGEVVAENNSPSTGTTGAIAPNAYPLVTLATDPPSATVFYIYESGDPPPDTAFLRYGRPYAMRCELGTADCDIDNPGEPLFSRQVVRPSYDLLLARDLFNPDQGLLAWTSLQEDYEGQDVFATYVIVR
ncbi:MAG: hypothetical protein H6669_07435 [Ardenticatenaceae bacterium]|nr:hypothetical protein [Ardenticatenaceae bacterium]